MSNNNDVVSTKHTKFLDMLKDVTIGEVEKLAELIDLSRQAIRAANTIKYAYTFAIGENCIKVFSNDEGHEKLTHSGIWQATYTKKTYEVACTQEEIFRLYKAEWLVKNCFAEKKTKEGVLTPEGTLAEACPHFRAFVLRAEDIIRRRAEAEKYLP